jgi:N-acetyl-anhydromuramyl-L-alanine amidase AmpD
MATDLYPKATYVPALPANVGGVLEPARVRLIVAHVAQGTSQSGIDSWFRNPAAQVSAHFSVSRLGVVHQHVPLSRIAWAERDYNDVAVSIEHLGYSGDKLTRPQLAASLRLMVWLVGEFPHLVLRRTGDPDGRGVIGHGELGVAGGDHISCPGTPILDQLAKALSLPKK